MSNKNLLAELPPEAAAAGVKLRTTYQLQHTMFKDGTGRWRNAGAEVDSYDECIAATEILEVYRGLPKENFRVLAIHHTDPYEVTRAVGN